MYIPSYDDLTPPIPDADIRDVFAGAARLTRSPAPLRPEPRIAGPAQPESALFACLHSSRAPQAMFNVARDFSPRIERHGAASVVLDIGGLGRLLGDAQAIGAELERTVRGCAADARIAVAPTQTAARLLALTSPRLAVVTADVAGALADLPLAALEPLLQEDGPPRPTRTRALPESCDVLAVCRRWGLRTLGEFAALPPAGLSERLGQPGLAWQRLACGLDPAPLVPDPGVPRYVRAMELEWPIDAIEPLSFVLARLLDPLAAALEQADRAAAALRCDLRLTDRTTHTRRLQLPAAMRDPRVLRTLLLLDLESHPPSAAIDIVTIEVDPAPSRIVQYSLLERATPSAETMATLLARLRALVGESRCGFAAASDTYRPDGFEMRPLEEVVGAKGAHRLKPLAPAPRPEAGSTTVLRRFRPPVAIRVGLDRGRPAHVAIDRRGMPGGEVVQRAGPWRTSGAWWEGDVHWDRDEWDVCFAAGTAARIYRDRITGVWFLEGVFD